MEPDVRDGLSADQKYLYDIVSAIKAGHIPLHLIHKKIGPHNHARWLNLANRLCRLWCSEHNLPSNVTAKLKQIVQFVVGVYAPMWFLIKRQNLWIKGPSLLLQHLNLLRLMNKTVVSHVTKYVKSSAWNGHSETILQAMLASDSAEDRDFAVQQIIKLRQGRAQGDTSVRPFRVVNIRMDATDLYGLIDWDNEQIYEPLLTCHYTQNELMNVIKDKMTVPDFPVHGQSIERCEQMVTRASAMVYGEERRDGFIKATNMHRQLLSGNDSKQDLLCLFV